MPAPGPAPGKNNYPSQTPAAAGPLGSLAKPKPKPKKRQQDAAPQTGFDWGDGNHNHKISLTQHRRNVQTQQLAPYNLGGNSIYGDPKQVRQAVNSATDVAYGQPILNQQQQIAASANRQNVDLPGWFKEYTDALAATRAASSQEYQQAANASMATAPAATGDPIADAATANRASMQNAFADMMRGQGANNTTNYDTRIGNAALMKLGMQNTEGLNGQNLTAQLGQLQKEKGEYANKTLAGFRGDQAKYNSDIAAADAATAAATGKLTAQRDEFNTSQANAKTKFDNTITRWGYTNAEWRAFTPAQRTQIEASQKPPAKAQVNTKDYYGHSWDGNGGSDKGWKNMSPSEKRSAVTLFQKAKGTGKSKSKPPSTRTPNNQWNAGLQYVRDQGKGAHPSVSEIASQGKVPNDIAQAVYEWSTHQGVVSAGTAAKLKKLGINVSPSHIRKG